MLRSVCPGLFLNAFRAARALPAAVRGPERVMETLERITPDETRAASAE
jgi:hypothetical protein